MKNIKKFGFYTLMVIIIFAGQFLMSQGLKSGKAPVILQKNMSGMVAMGNQSKPPDIIYFWAEWCGLCKMMKQQMSAVSSDYEVLTIAIKSGDDLIVQEYLKNNKLRWNVVNDPLGLIAEKYQVKGVPSIFFLDQQGQIKLASSGYMSEIGLRVRLWLSTLF